MKSTVRNRLIGLGVVWGILLSAIPALVMIKPFRISGFLIATLICAALSGSAGTLIAGRRAAARSIKTTGKKRGAFAASLATGLFQGLVGGVVAAALIWALMAVTLSGLNFGSPVELATLMSPRVFLGGFFVALSVFIYVLVGGLLLGPAFGTLVNRLVRKGEA